jgi:ribosomal protein S27AE
VLCETCLDSARKTYLTVDNEEISFRKGKCSLCGRKGRVHPVELQIPDFSKGIVKKEVNVCSKCL